MINIDMTNFLKLSIRCWVYKQHKTNVRYMIKYQNKYRNLYANMLTYHQIIVISKCKHNLNV
jgi:hypothetical protein